MSTELIPHEQNLPDKPAPANLMAAIAQAALDPRVDPDKMRALYELHKDIQADERKSAYMRSMTALQARVPDMTKSTPAKNSKYASYENIMAVMRPLLSEFGFAVSFDEESSADKTVTFRMTISHAAGHSETKRLTVAIDQSARSSSGNAIRPAIQDSGSTTAYARRYLLKMAFNIVERAEDTDGEDRRTITAEQVRDIETALADGKRDRAKFLKWVGVAEIADIPASSYKSVMDAIRRNQ